MLSKLHRLCKIVAVTTLWIWMCLTMTVCHQRSHARVATSGTKTLWRQQLRGGHLGYTRCMPRNPFTYDRDETHDQSSEFGFGRGHFPDPRIDFSDGGIRSMIPIADPDQDAQFLELMAIRRMDLADPQDQPSPYVAGNTDRYGAQPPLVRERRTPTFKPYPLPRRSRMQRHW
jgi:hypothetical protein